MEYEPEGRIDLHNQNERDLMKAMVINKLREAHELISAYRAAYQEQKEFGHDAFEKRVRDNFLLPMLLGAPGEQCEACSGSGRKKDS